ncbi:ubiquinol--cytochrome-c reductase subunit 2 NDAI_0J00110 [Naumovozyma dairenensis CBS 421]|uniref:Cytochrome b-c1 complex subunit 2, mitochondrial n=1 Tax=Naumovozyma dairenensis (strain ATCC 10597 / BCRC 20456 / CBS 421 / NBRC 0211 / NRRL Y-12639) TaxID=1071378 RepID=G0WHC3_NAUDC|nr:hypothetical protein NDAI_0J00110 [Naumovozyma dairenensis CBS 421]CCD26903.1 hypothetical protein NDAI_0J00110 [Naumovozyma dairenensis CBS 421]
MLSIASTRNTVVKNLLRVSSKAHYNVLAVDSPSKVSTLAVKVHAGSRYANKDGLSHLLSRFNFQNTNDKSALRLVRETELLSGELASTVDREYITLKATFLKEHLPYYVNVLANALYKTSFRPHELPESVLPAANYDLARYDQNPINVAHELLYNITYRSGLGNPILYDGVEPIALEEIQSFADDVYTKDNIDIIGSGVNANDLERFVNDSLFNSLPVGKSLVGSSATKSFVGKEARLRNVGPSVVTIGIPIDSAEDFGKYYALSKYLTAKSTPLSNLVSSSKVDFYNNKNGLFILNVIGSNPEIVNNSVRKLVTELKKNIDLSVTKEYARLELELENQFKLKPLEIDFGKVKNFKLDKFNYAAVGDVSKLPFLDDLY